MNSIKNIEPNTNTKCITNDYIYTPAMYVLTTQHNEEWMNGQTISCFLLGAQRRMQSWVMRMDLLIVTRMMTEVLLQLMLVPWPVPTHCSLSSDFWDSSNCLCCLSGGHDLMWSAWMVHRALAMYFWIAPSIRATGYFETWIAVQTVTHCGDDPLANFQ